MERGERFSQKPFISERFSQTVNGFHGSPPPEQARLAGYAALIEQYTLPVPIPPKLTAVAQRHHPKSTDTWRLLSPRHAPEPTLAGELLFALKWEGVDLSVLAALCAAVPDAEFASIIRAQPASAYARRLWFLHEWLTGRTLDIPDIGKVRAVPLLDPRQQFGLPKRVHATRQKIIDNLPGTVAFCPLVHRTPMLDAFIARGYDQRARQITGKIHSDVLTRAAAFLLLSDSRSSFSIEGEYPSAQRANRWGQIIGEAGNIPLSLSELERLQRIVIGDARFVRLGLRTGGGFVGLHDRNTQEPLPDHISAKADDLPNLIAGIIAYAERSIKGGMDPVAAAAATAFGFVYVHPFEDGNGRIHRWLIHHILAAMGYNPPGIVFPVSAVILREIHAYRMVLESYSRALLPLIRWQPTDTGNIEALNETRMYYRYFNATAHAEFLAGCIAQTIEQDLPNEITYLQNFDLFAKRVQTIIDMPNRTVDLLCNFLRQGLGHLSKRAREKEFAQLIDDEIHTIEAIYAECFSGRIESASQDEESAR